MPRGWLARPLLIVVFACAASPAFVNRTIDDDDGDSNTGQKPVYFPSGSSQWIQGNACEKCPILPDQAFHNTWHEAYQLPSDPDVRTVTVHFNGTAVYVFNMFATPVDASLQNSSVTYMDFELDGTPVESYLAPFPTAASPERRLVYTNSNIADGAHTLVIRVLPGKTGEDASLVRFDYIEYTTTDAEASSNSSEPFVASRSQSRPPTATIVGAAVGGV